jgi:DNA-binding transcriptional ArsR family regulator
LRLSDYSDIDYRMKLHDIPNDPNPIELAAVIETFKALADSNRLRIILALIRGEQPVSHLVAYLGIPQSSVSRHLAMLRASDQVITRRQANQVFYRLSNAHLRDLVLQAFSHAEHERLGLPDHVSNTGTPPTHHHPPFVESRS